MCSGSTKNGFVGEQFGAAIKSSMDKCPHLFNIPTVTLAWRLTSILRQTVFATPPNILSPTPLPASSVAVEPAPETASPEHPPQASGSATGATISSDAPRPPRRKKPGPKPFPADKYLRKLSARVAKDVLANGGTEAEAEAAVYNLRASTPNQLAKRIRETYGERVSGKTLLRNSELLKKDWAGCRKGTHQGRSRPTRLRPGRAYESDEQAQKRDAIDAGGLSLRETIDAPIRGGRSKKDKADEAEADEHLRKLGINPHAVEWIPVPGGPRG